MQENKIGDHLKKLRRSHGLTQQEVADRLGISNRTLSAWECGTAMPDILLLPALADLYGVTVDELLRGRKDGDGALAEDGGRPLKEGVGAGQEGKVPLQEGVGPKKTLSRFCTQSCITTAVFTAGLAFFFLGLYKDLTTVAWTGWQWWLPLLFIGLADMVVTAGVFLAFWQSAERAFEGDTALILRVRRQLSCCVYIPAALSLGFGITFAVTASKTVFSPERTAAAVGFFVLSLGLFLFGGLSHTRALKASGEEARIILRGNAKLAEKIFCFALIPAALACLEMAVMPAFSYPVSHDEQVSETDGAEFVRKMESIVIDGRLVGHDTEYWFPSGGKVSSETAAEGEHFLPLSACAEGAGAEWIDLGDGFYAKFTEDGEACEVMAVLYCGEDMMRCVDLFAWRVAEQETGLTFYDLRHAGLMLVSPAAPPLADGAYASGEVSWDGEGYSYTVTVYAYYGGLFYAVGGGVIFADILVCTGVYFAKRRRYA